MKTLIAESALQLAKQLGANTSKFSWVLNLMLVSWDPGPRMVCYFNKVINPESFATLGIEKVLPDIESSIAYANRWQVK